MGTWKSAIIFAAILSQCVPATAADADKGKSGNFPASGWYLRGDVSYSAGESVYDFAMRGAVSETNRFGVGLGAGYRFGPMLRTDLTINFVGNDRYYSNEAEDSISAYHGMWSGLVSGYADLMTYAGFTPYVGAGVGVLRTGDNMSIRLPGAASEVDNEQTEFAYSLYAGVGRRVADNLTLDLGYMFLASPKTQYLDTDSMTVKDGVQQHQLRVGLRYDLR